MSSLYLDLIKKFHPDVWNDPQANERTAIINKNKDDEGELYHLAILWGVIEKKACGDSCTGRRPLPVNYQQYDYFLFETSVYLKNNISSLRGPYMADFDSLPGWAIVPFDNWSDAYDTYMSITRKRPGLKRGVFR
jgi:hypothetical protein